MSLDLVDGIAAIKETSEKDGQSSTSEMLENESIQESDSGSDISPHFKSKSKMSSIKKSKKANKEDSALP